MLLLLLVTVHERALQKLCLRPNTSVGIRSGVGFTRILLYYCMDIDMQDI